MLSNHKAFRALKCGMILLWFLLFSSIDAFVQDEKILKYLVKSEFPGRVQVVGGTFDEYFVSIALQQKSPLRKPINKALLKLIKTESWNEILNRYIQ